MTSSGTLEKLLVDHFPDIVVQEGPKEGSIRVILTGEGNDAISSGLLDPIQDGLVVVGCHGAGPLDRGWEALLLK
jgi:hypothetical protein